MSLRSLLKAATLLKPETTDTSAAGAFQPVDHRWAAGLAVKAGQLVENAGTVYKVNADMTLPGSFNTTGLTAVGGVSSVIDATGATDGQVALYVAASSKFLPRSLASGAVVGARAYTTATTSITTGVAATISLPAEEFDTDGFHDTTTNTSRLTVPTGKAGRYRVDAAFTIAGNATGRRVLKVVKNGGLNGVARAEISVNSVSYPTTVRVSEVITLADGDYLELTIVQDAGTSLALTGSILYLSDGTTTITAEMGLTLLTPSFASGAPSLTYPKGTAATTVPRPVWLDVRDYGAVGDGTTDDTAAFIAAQTDVPTGSSAGSVIFVPPAPVAWNIVAGVLLNKPLVTWQGVGRSSRIKSGGTATSSGTMNSMFYATGATALDQVAFEKLSFIGNAQLPPADAPYRSRTLTGSAAQTAVQGVGSQYAPGGTYTPVAQALSNWSFLDCFFDNWSSLPVVLRGVQGRVLFARNKAINNLDFGFVQCSSVIFTENHINRGADNGVSISRANKHVVCADNVITSCAYSGIWVSGFVGSDQQGNVVSQPGPDFFTITGNTIENVGNNGVSLRDAPRYGTVVGNSITNVSRGPLDESVSANDEFGNGVEITGFPHNTTFTQNATDIVIADNLFRSCANNGVKIAGADRVRIAGNLMTLIGSQFRQDGTTAVLTSDLDMNNGVTVYGANVGDLSIINNEISDSRGTPYSNRMVGVTGSPTRLMRRGNKYQGTRVADPDAALAYSRTGESTAAAALRAALVTLGLVDDNTTA